MRRYLRLLLLVPLLGLALPAYARDVPPSFADLIETLSPAVVNISTTQKVKAASQMQFQGIPEGKEFEPFREFFERFGGPGMPGMPGVPGAPKERDVTSLGSGFVVDPEGYVVTNNHVIAEADKVSVTFQDDSNFEAKVVGRDPKTDLALLKIETGKKLPYVTFGDSDDMRVGDWVIAIGNPFGLGGSVSAGIISARSRNINAGPFDDFIQTDAAINRGNSGGPLFNVKGEVIGVNSAIFSPSGGNIGIGFAIPTALAQPVLDQLKEFGRTHRGWLGVKIQHVTDEIAESVDLKRAQGALVLEVTPESPAAKAGVEAGDIIISFNGTSIKEMRNLPRLVAETKVGAQSVMEVWRNGRKQSLTLTLGETPEEDVAKSTDEDSRKSPVQKPDTQEYLGLQLAPTDAALRRQFSLADDAQGLVVMGVKPNSAGSESGLRRMDVIVEANQQSVSTVKSFREAIESARKSGRKNALLRVSRGSQMQFVTIATQE